VPVDGAELRARRVHRLVDGLRLARVIEKLVDDLVDRGARRIALALHEETPSTPADDVVVEVRGLDVVGEPRSDRARGVDGQDTGLGLTLARALVDAMGGRLGEPAPRVWRVQLSLPLAAPPSALAPGAGRLPVTATDGGVLVVDDNAVNRAVATSLVRRLGLTVAEAEDGLTALDAVARARFAALLLDHEMPGLDGVECARRLRADPRHDALALVLVTATNEPALARAALEAGVDAVLVKPLTLAALQPMLRPALSTAPAASPSAAAQPAAPR
jgi:CheY-like chemotaxis protein